jgi:hypothetical protein
MKIIMNSLLKSFDVPMKESLKDSVNEAMKQMLSSFEMTDKTESRIAKPGYWTTYLKHTRKVSIGEMKQTEEFVFRMKE